jgi:Ni2+-binding GTPase involved in maturation of urease and hydrogenase
MDLHIVGGFLGSGKTTAIAAAARLLLGRGQRVGVITNDQGRYLVDTAFFDALRVPAVEVTHGCFCCNYDDLDARLEGLIAATQPDVIFAESVGSCADVVATVVNPLLALRTTPASFSVFADARLLLARLRGAALPFAEEVIYLFDQQIEEAGLLIVNKCDLLTLDEIVEIQERVKQALPGKRCRLQSVYDPAAIEGWLAALAAGEGQPGPALAAIDYARYGAGEAALAWLDAALRIDAGDRSAEAALAIMHGLRDRLAAAAIPIGHVKFSVGRADDGAQHKISLTTLNDAREPIALPELPSGALSLLINARVQTDAEALRALLGALVAEVQREFGAVVEMQAVDSFHPPTPTPRHRVI